MPQLDVPRFQHDCAECTWLGTYNEHDLYYCPQNGRQTVIARYSDDPPDYKSGLAFAEHDEHLYEAYRRALLRGLIKRAPKRNNRHVAPVHSG